MNSERPHITVATVIERDGRFLMVEEIKHGKTVYNQPAGHVEGRETLIEAALRETLEETGYRCEVTALLGLYQYTAPSNGITYHRSAFIARAIERVEGYQLDSDIEQALWLNIDDIRRLDAENRLRSPIVLLAIEDYLLGKCHPLELIAPAY